MVVLKVSNLSIWTAVLWWFYVVVTIAWVFLLVGVDYGNDPTLVVVNASTAELTGLLALTVINVLFVGLANWTLWRSEHSDSKKLIAHSPRQSLNQAIVGFGGLAIISTAFLPALFTSSSIAFDAVGGEPDLDLAFMSYLIYGAMPLGVVGVLAGWLFASLVGRPPQGHQQAGAVD